MSTRQKFARLPLATHHWPHTSDQSLNTCPFQRDCLVHHILLVYSLLFCLRYFKRLGDPARLLAHSKILYYMYARIDPKVGFDRPPEPPLLWACVLFVGWVAGFLWTGLLSLRHCVVHMWEWSSPSHLVQLPAHCGAILKTLGFRSHTT